MLVKASAQEWDTEKLQAHQVSVTGKGNTQAPCSQSGEQVAS